MGAGVPPFVVLELDAVELVLDATELLIDDAVLAIDELELETGKDDGVDDAALLLDAVS